MVGPTGALALVNKHEVIGFLAAAGTRDPDVLYAWKLALLAGSDRVRLAGTGLLVLGLAATATVTLAVIGVPAVLAGWWIRHRASRRVTVVEAGFAEFVGR